MKFTITLLLFALFAISCIHATTDDEVWESFKKTHNKNYGATEEHDSRKEIFLTRYHEIEAHNKLFAEGKVGFKKGINAYADLTPEELKKVHPSGIRLPKHD